MSDYRIEDLPPELAGRIEVNSVSGCWEWTGARHQRGYGSVSWEGSNQPAHRVVYTLLAGPIPDGLTLDHVEARGCASRACCWPAHLEPVTGAENTRRSWHKKVSGPAAPWKECSCRDAAGRRLHRRCPRLTEKNHGAWYARYEAPRGPDGKRRQPLLGPFPTRRAAAEALAEAIGRVRHGNHVEDRHTTFSQYLIRRLNWWESEKEIKPSTLESYREAIELYFIPGLGHVRLMDLRDSHFRDLYASMRKINRQDDKHDETLRRLLQARAEVPHVPGRRYSTRALSEARIKRIHAVAQSALSAAVPQTIEFNPAAGVKFGGKRGGRKQRPLLWTAPRVDRWRQTGEVPAPVMVWTREQTGVFLDSATGERLYAIFHLAAYYGLRRSELVGLTWAEVDLGQHRLHVRQAQVDDELDSTKSEESTRQLELDDDTVTVLTAWRKAQLAERLAWGPAWTDSGYVFTREDGTPLRPSWVSRRFLTLAARAGAPPRPRRQPADPEPRRDGLPPIRFHDLRHGTATMLLAAGQKPKVISEILGHATTAFTMDVYTEVADELKRAAAAALAAYIPRANRPNSLGGM